MIDFLPINFIRSFDTHYLGRELTDLGKLKNLGFPVPDGLVILGPVENFKSIVKAKRVRDGVSLRLSNENLADDFFSITIPKELKKELVKKGFDPEKVWRDLIKIWTKQVLSQIFSGSFNQSKVFLTAQPVFFTENFTSFGTAHLTFGKQMVEVRVERGELSLKQKEVLDEIVKRVETKLLHSYKYHWIADAERIHLVKLDPNVWDSVSFNRAVSSPESLKKETIAKLFLKHKSGLSIDKNIDGLIFYPDDKADLDSEIFRLVESALAIYPKPLIFVLSDLNQAKIVLFGRNKKNLDNISVAVFASKNPLEFMSLKRELSAMGLSRKGSLKLWLWLETPQNLINIEQYIDVGIDGVVINLDKLNGFLSGDLDLAGYSTDNRSYSLLKFLEIPIKAIHKAKIPVLFEGEIISNQDVLNHLVKKGAWGFLKENKDQELFFDSFDSLNNRTYSPLAGF